MFHAIMVVGLNQCSRYDEIHKLTIGSATVSPGTSGDGSLYFSLTVEITTQLYQGRTQFENGLKKASLGIQFYLIRSSHS